MEPASARVTIYSLPGCGRCRRLVAHLARHLVPFTEVNVLTQPRALARITNHHQPVLPLVTVDGQPLATPSPRALSAALRRRPPGPAQAITAAARTRASS
jgi:glutaredoxin